MAVIYALTSNDITLIGEAAQDLGGGDHRIRAGGTCGHGEDNPWCYRPLPSAL